MDDTKTACEDTVLNMAANVGVDAALSAGNPFLVILTQGEISGVSFDYAYSIGRSEGRLPEVFLTCPEKSEDGTRLLLETVVMNHPPEEDEKLLPFTINGVISRGALRRFRWMKLDELSNEAVKRDFMTALPYRYSMEYVDTFQVYQLLVSDKHNRLPGEPRYHDDGSQLVMELVSA